MATIPSSPHYSFHNIYSSTRKASEPNNDRVFNEDQRNGATAVAASAESYNSQSITEAGPSGALLNFQSRIAEGSLLDRNALKSIGNTWEFPDDSYEEIVSGMQMSLEANYRTMPEEPSFSNDPRTHTYATVVVDGKVVATIDNQGIAETDNDMLNSKFRDILISNVNGTNGPDLAQARAQQLADLLGGKIVKSENAMTQAAFDALPPPEAALPSVDYEAMKKDPLYAQLEALREKRNNYLNRHN